MTSPTRRSHTRVARAGAATAGALAVLLLTGCDPVRAGAAVTIGDDRITHEQLAEVVARGLADPAAAEAQGDKAAYTRTVLSRLVNNRVLALAAQRAGVVLAEGEVDAQLAEYAKATPNGTLEELQAQASQQAGIAPSDLRAFVRDIVLDRALADALTADLTVTPAQLQELYAQNPAYDQVRSAHILVPTRAQAQQILTQVTADPTRFADLAKRFSTDTSNKDQGGDLGLVGRGSFVPEFERAVFAARTGQVLLVQTQFGFHVVQVLERQTTTLAEATPELRRQALEVEREERKTAALTAAAEDLDISVSPRFGAWQLDTAEVVARDAVLSTPAAESAPAGGTAPAEGAPPADPAAPPAG